LDSVWGEATLVKEPLVVGETRFRSARVSWYASRARQRKLRPRNSVLNDRCQNGSPVGKTLFGSDYTRASLCAV